MRSLARFAARRLALLLLTLFAVSVLIFSITQLLPGDVATMILGMQATPQDLATIRAQLGLDQSPIVQFWRWLGGVLQGDLGVSTRFQRPSSRFSVRRSRIRWFWHRRYPVRRAAWPRAGAFVRAAPQLAAGPRHLVGLDLRRRHAGIRHRRSDDHRVQHVAGMAPAFCRRGSARTLSQAMSELILPVLSLSFVILAYILRMMRASVTDVLDSPFVKAALLKGLDRRRVILYHVLPAGTRAYALRDSALHRMDGGRPGHRREPVRLPRDRAIAGVRDS